MLARAAFVTIACSLVVTACQSTPAVPDSITQPKPVTGAPTARDKNVFGKLELEASTGFDAEWRGTGSGPNPNGVAESLWSPDGQRFLIAQNGNGLQYRSDSERGNASVALYDGVSGDRLWSRDLVGEIPLWSPDGRWLKVNSRLAYGSNYQDDSDVKVLDSTTGATIFSEPPPRLVSLGPTANQYLRDVTLIDAGWDAATGKLWAIESHILNWALDNSSGGYRPTDTRCRLRRYTVSAAGLTLESSLDIQVTGACIKSSYGRYHTFLQTGTNSALLVASQSTQSWPYTAFRLVALNLTTGLGTPLVSLGSGTFYNWFGPMTALSDGRVIVPEIYNGGYGDRVTMHTVDPVSATVTNSAYLGNANYIGTDPVRSEILVRAADCVLYYTPTGALTRTYRFTTNASCSSSSGAQPGNIGWRSGRLVTVNRDAVSMVTDPGLPTESRVELQIDPVWQGCITDDRRFGVQWMPEFRLLFNPVRGDDVLLVANRLNRTQNGCSGATGGFVRRFNSSQGVTMRVPTTRQTPHTSNAYSTAAQPNGTLVASAGRDGDIKLWNRSNGTLQFTLETGTPAYAVAWSPDGLRLASGGEGGTVLLWDIATRSVVQRFEGHTYTVRSVAFSPDGSSLASAGWDRTARIWNVASGEQRYALTHDDFVNAVVFSPSGSSIVTAGSDGEVRFYSALTSALERSIQAGTDAAYALVFSADGTQFAVGGADKDIRVYSAMSGALQRTIQGHFAPIRSLLWLRDNLSLVSSGMDNTVRVWDTGTGKELTKMTTASTVFDLETTTFNRLITTQGDGALNQYRIQFVSDPWLVTASGQRTDPSNANVTYSSAIYRRNNEAYGVVTLNYAAAATTPLQFYLTLIPRDAAGGGNGNGRILLPYLLSDYINQQPGGTQRVITQTFEFAGKVALEFNTINDRVCCDVETVRYTN